MNRPFLRSYWVEEGKLLAGFYPGDEDPTKADGKLNALLDCGVTCIVNLMEANEVGHDRKPFIGYESRFAELARKRGRTGRCLRFAIVDCSVPHHTEMRSILEAIGSSIASGEAVYVHCWGGRGRTGTVVGCHLRHTKNLSGDEALKALRELTKHNREAFPQVPETVPQRAFIRSWTDKS